MTKVEESGLGSSFRIGARFGAAPEELRERLEQLPCLKRIANKTGMAYAIMEAGGRSRSELEIGENGITLVYRFERPSMSEYARNLSMLFAVLAHLGGMCKPEMRDLYPYAMEGLGRRAGEVQAERVENVGVLMRRLEGLAQMNSDLSLKLIAVKSELEKYRACSEKLSRFAREAIGHHMALARGRDRPGKIAADAFGLEPAFGNEIAGLAFAGEADEK